MSQFYDQASLVVVPSGYKAGTVYAQKPLTTDGQLAFTRTGDTATRVNSAGLIEKVRTNLVLQSNTFSTTWANSDSTETGGQAGDDGTNNAWLLTSTLSGGFIFQSVAINGQTTFSVYAKAGTRNGIILYSVHVAQGRNFNLSTGAVGSPFIAAPENSQIQSVGNGWYRCSITVTSSSTNNFRIYVGDGSSTALGNVVIQNAQGESGDVATPYIPTTTAAVSVGPMANVPRLDYLGSTCPRLLLEPQRTNLLQFSEQFNNAYWSLSGATITSNTTVAPDGTQSADTLTGVSGNFRVFRTVSGLSNIDYSFSVFVKQGTSNTVKLDFVNVADGPIFNFTTRTFTTVSGWTTRFEQHANGWLRLFATRVSNTTSAGLGINVAGAGQTVFIWGAQMEAGSYGTSYIPTLAASATRGADSSISANISSLFGATEGSFYVQLTHDGRNTNNAIPVFLRSSINGNFNRATYLQFGSTNLTLNVYDAGTLQAAISGGTYTNGQTLKIAFAYKANDFVLYVNGVQIGTDTSGAISSSLSFIDFGSYMLAQSTFQYDGKVSQALLFKTRLTNAQLAELTTL